MPLSFPDRIENHKATKENNKIANQQRKNPLTYFHPTAGEAPVNDTIPCNKKTGPSHLLLTRAGSISFNTNSRT